MGPRLSGRCHLQIEELPIARDCASQLDIEKVEWGGVFIENNIRQLHKKNVSGASPANIGLHTQLSSAEVPGTGHDWQLGSYSISREDVNNVYSMVTISKWQSLTF